MTKKGKILRGDCLERGGAWLVCKFKGGIWQERGGGVFEVGGWGWGVIPQCTLWFFKTGKDFGVITKSKKLEMPNEMKWNAKQWPNTTLEILNWRDLS